MPIRTGSRLERLIELRRQVNLQIEVEQRAERLRNPGRPEKPRKKQRPAPVQARLRELGVTALQVKTWAYDVGLIAEIVRGRVPGELVESYAQAHAPRAPYVCPVTCEYAADVGVPGAATPPCPGSYCSHYDPARVTE